MEYNKPRAAASPSRARGITLTSAEASLLKRALGALQDELGETMFLVAGETIDIWRLGARLSTLTAEAA